MTRNTSFSIEVDILEEFRKVCKDNCINQSAYVQQKMDELVKKFAKK
jgi:hypothetical protein